MPARPLLIFPHPENVDVLPGPRGGGTPPKPSMSPHRRKTFDDKFKSALNYIQSSSMGVDPEAVLVIEIIGRHIGDFSKATKKIEGLEWLGEVDLDEDKLKIGEDIYPDEKSREEATKARGRLYMISSNQSGLKKIKNLWDKWKKGKTLERGYGKWKDLFDYIYDLRYWNEIDRIEETGILDYLKNEIQIKKDTASSIFFEIELHFRKLLTKAKIAENEVSKLIEEKGGEIKNLKRMENIGFHAMKVALPIQAAEEIYAEFNTYREKNDRGGLVKSDRIKYFRPISQQWTQEADIAGYPLAKRPPKKPLDETDKPPVIELLDGLPMANHAWLEDRIIIDDPDNYADDYAPEQRRHGTSMASLICHGDLENPEGESLIRKFYVRPIMKPDELSQKDEQIPGIEFPEDLLERAVVDIFDKSKADSVRVISLSIGNLYQPFVREMSSWARLIDWLSWKYKVLFIVSAGNYSSENEIRFASQNDNTISDQMVKEIDRSIRRRKILSPAESLNCLTVGAVHSDYSDVPSDDIREALWEKDTFIAEYSRLGSGYRRSIKPDIVVPGGRQFFTKEKENDEIILKPDKNEVPGQQVAYVDGGSPENINNTTYTRGTSNAAALTTHTAGLLYEVIEDLSSNSSERRIPQEYESLLIKSLLVHGANWNGMEKKLQDIEGNTRKFRRIVSQYLGYGKPQFQRVMECTSERVTILGFGKLSQEKPRRFTLLIPDSCKSIRYKLFATLAYFTPINPFHFNYRMAKLFFTCPLAKGNRQEADHQQVQGGTIQHEIFNLDVIEDDVEIYMQCNAADSFNESIPYALSLTLEAKEETPVDIYNEIKQAIEISVRAGNQ